MPIPFVSSVDLNRNELLNARVQNLATAPAHAAGLIYYDTTLGFFRVSNGSTWVSLAPGALDTEAVQDVVGAMVAGTTVTATYDDTANTLTFAIGAGQIVNAHVSASAAISADKLVEGTTNKLLTAAERTKIAASTAVSVDGTPVATYNIDTSPVTKADVGLGNVDNTSDVNKPVSTAQQAAIDTASTNDRARANHTGTQLAATISDFQTTVSANTDVAAAKTAQHTHTNKAVLDATTASYTTAEATKLSGVATGATANSPDATLLNRANHTGTQASSTISDLATVVKAYRIDEFAAPTAARTMNNQKITGLADPTAAQDAATKAYVDATAVGLDVKPSVRVATTVNSTLATNYVNGVTIDGITIATGNRILIKNQTTPSENGIYVVQASGAPIRATDADSSAEVTGGMFVFVEEGTTNADTGWVLTNNGAITLGTTGLTFAQFSGPGSWTAGNGLTQTGTTFDVGAGTGITVAADSVAIDTAVVVRKYAATIGNGASTAITVTHNLNTLDVTWSLRDATSNAFVFADVVAASVNTLTVTFATAPATNAYRIVVHG